MLSALMRLRERRGTGWVAIAPAGARVHAVHVVAQAGDRPQVRWAASAEWRDPAAALRDLRRSGLRGARRVALLQPGQYQLLSVDAPELPREEWRDALRWRLKELVDFPVDDAGIDVLAVPADPQQRRRASAFAVAASRDVLAPLAAAGHAAGTPWQAVDIPETALRNLATLESDAGRGEALLHVAAGHSTLVVTVQGELLLARHIDVTLAQLRDADADQRQLAYERVSLELQRTLDNVERQFSHAHLPRLQVAPGALLEDFIGYVRELVYVPVTGFDLAAAVDLSAVPQLRDPLEQGPYLTAIGAALR